MYNYNNSFPQTDPHSTVCLWSNSRTQTRPYSTIAPHWSSSYPEYLSPTWDEDTQQAVVWTRLREHRKLARKGLADIREQYKALRQEQQTCIESHHESSSHDMLQRQEDGKKHPIGYYSATLNKAQQSYDIYELELLAIAECLKHWRPYLAGSPHEIIVHTNHANLTYWCQPQKISR